VLSDGVRSQIEEHVLHTIKEEQLFSRLSPHEQEFAKGCAGADAASACTRMHGRLPTRAPARPPAGVRRCRYTDAVERHFRASVLDALPPQYDSLLQQIEDADAGASYDMSAWLACVLRVCVWRLVC
jgi:hypothetical protein